MSILLDELRPQIMHQHADKWGTAIDLLFSICFELNYRGDDVPASLEFSPGACSGDCRETDSQWFDICIEVESDELVEDALIIGRYLQWCVNAGLSY